MIKGRRIIKKVPVRLLSSSFSAIFFLLLLIVSIPITTSIYNILLLSQQQAMAQKTTTTTTTTTETASIQLPHTSKGEIVGNCLVDITTCFTQSAPPTTPTTIPTTIPLSTNFLTYENSILGIRIKYLNTWNVSQSIIGNNSISFIPPSKVNDSTVDNLSVQVLPSQGKTLSKWVSEQINKDMYYSKRNFGINGNFRLIESTPFNFKGNSAQNVTFASKGFVPDKTMEIYIINGNKIYILIYFASLGRYSTYLPVIQKMIDSFQIVNTNATGAVTAGQVQASLPTQQLSNGKAAVQGEIEASCLVDITTCFTQSAPPTTLPLQTNTTSTTTNATANEATNATTITSPSTENTTNATSQSGANATNATNSSLLTYENSTYGIKILYPSDWKYKEEQGIGTNPTSVQLSGLTIATFNPTANASTSNPPNTLGVVVQVQNSPFNNIDGIYMDPVVHESLKYQVIKSINSTANLNDIASVIEKKILSLIESNTTLNLAGNNPARKLEYKVFGGETRVMDVFTIKGNTLYRIIYYAKSPEYGRYLPIAQRMINSFTMVNTNLSSSTAKPYQINYWQRYFLPYENSSLGIKIHYPSDWYKRESNDMPNTITFTCKYHCDIGFVTVKAENIPFQGVTLNDYSRSVMQIDKRLYPDFNIVELGKATILGGIPVQRIVFTGKVGEQTIKEMDLFMIKDNKIYQIRFGSTIYQYPFILPVVQKMIDSFQIVNTTTTTAKTISTIWQR